jgi:Uma2 family endonuclease
MAPPTPVRPAFTPGPCMAQTLYRLTVRQFRRMIDDGTIGEDERVELIEGLLVSKPRRHRPHIVAGNKGLRILWRMIPPGWHVAKGVPILASDWSRPEPDLAVIRGVVDDYDEREATAHDTALVVEIADANLPADRADMTRVYAAAGIPVYWIINLIDDQVEIFSEPRREGYQSHQILARGHDVPVVIGGVEVAWLAVSDVLP